MEHFIESECGADTMKATFISDEFSQDFAACLDFADVLRLDSVELRSVEGSSIDELSDDAAHRLHAMSSDRGIQICGLDTFCFKHEYGANQNLDSLAKLDRAADLACILGAPWLRIFAFWRQEELEFDAIRDAVLEAARIVGQRPVRLLIENGTFSAVGSGAKLADLLDMVDLPQVGALWDPANVVNGDWPEMVDDGLARLRRHLVHVHVKNPQVGEPGSMVFGPLGSGIIDWAKHLRRCAELGYDGYLSLETHWRSTRTLAGRAQLDFPRGHDFSDGAEIATRETMAELIDLIAAIPSGIGQTSIQRQGLDKLG